MRSLQLFFFLLVAITLIAGCSTKNDDDDDNGKENCIICSTTSECTDALGVGWVCLDGCCTEYGDDTSSDDTGTSDDDSVDQYGLSWADIPEGFVGMGCSTGDQDCQTPETPRHTVGVSEFEITKMEITQEQYNSVMQANPSANAGCVDCPVEQVTWTEAKTYCETVGGRLPTEAEWEYAARGETSTKFPCGDDPACLDNIAWYSANSGGATQPVAQMAPNGFGLYDMLGNVFEWVSDWYGDTFYESSPLSNPAGPDFGTSRVLRGGAYSSDPWGLRVSYRGSGDPAAAYLLYGFRCAREVE